MARQQDGCAGVAQARDDRSGRGACLGVHAGGRLVEDHHLGTADEREREPEPLSLAAGQPPVARPGHGAETDQVQQLVGVARVRVETPVLRERLARLGAGIDPAALEHQPDPGSERRTALGRVDPENAGRAAVAASIALDDLDGGRLAGAVRSEQRDELARADRQRDAVEDRARAVALDQPVHDDRGVAAGHERDLPELAFEVRVGQLADLDRADDPAAVHEIGLRPGDHPVGRLDRLVRIDDGRPRGVVLPDERARGIDRVVGQHPDHGQALGRMLRELRLEQRELVAARDAARPPEVDDDGLAGEAGQVERRAVEGGAGDRRRRRPDRRPSAASTPIRRRDAEPTTGRTATRTAPVVTTARSRARTIGRRGMRPLATGSWRSLSWSDGPRTGTCRRRASGRAPGRPWSRHRRTPRP